MRKAKRALDLHCESCCDAFDESKRLTDPSWRRSLKCKNTPKQKQADFEHEAIEKEARRLYHEKLRRIARRRGEVSPV